MIDNEQTKNFCLRWQGKQRRIGITGGIASGKTLIGNFLFNAKKWPILDADSYSREALKTNSQITKKVLLRYGDQIISKPLQDHKAIDRKKLAQIIFKNHKEKYWLESLIHPFINKRINEELEKHKLNSVILLIIPLLFEKNYTKICSEILYVDCSKEKQVERLKKRNKISVKEALQRINAQWEPSLKKQFADFIINNSNDNESWKEQLENIYNF